MHVDRSKLRSSLVVSQNAESLPTSAPTADEPPLPRVTWCPPGEPPPNGGLHQLTLAGVELPKKSTLLEDADFSTYRIGMNNRRLLGAIVADLNALLGVKMTYGFSRELEAFPTVRQHRGFGFAPNGNAHFSIGEAAIDQLVEPFNDPEDRRAIASFAIAHEFFHALLRHADMRDWPTRQRGFTVKRYASCEKIFELQADYLATKYLVLRGMPTDPVIRMFETGNFEETKAYPSGAARADNVRRAREPGFELELFQNEIVDCLEFLELIASRDESS